MSLALLIDGIYFPLFLVGIGAPSWWLGYLALLARPVGQNGTTAIEWYPAGRLVVWAVVLGGGVVTVGLQFRLAPFRLNPGRIGGLVQPLAFELYLQIG